jgi:anti-anti-sigma factor
MPLTIAIREKRGVTIMDVGGELCVGDCLQLHQTIKELLAENRRKLALNFKNVQRADSFGMGSLAASFASVERNDGVVKVFSPSKDVHAAMQEIRLDQVIETFSREKDALSSFAN